MIDIITKYQKNAFAWGSFDCITLADDWANYYDLPRPFSDVLGKYRTKVSAAKLYILKKNQEPEKTMAEYLGKFYQPLEGGFPSDGCLVFREIKGAAIGGAFGVVYRRCPWFMTDSGLAATLQLNSDKFWLPS